MKRTAQIVGGLFLCFGALWIVFAVAMRTKFRPVQNAVRRMNRAVFNPRAMETAGQPGAYASVIQHLGRTSGASYETPVQALASGNGFMIPCRTGRAQIGSRTCGRAVLRSSSMKGTPIGWIVQRSSPGPSLSPMFRSGTNGASVCTASMISSRFGWWSRRKQRSRPPGPRDRSNAMLGGSPVEYAGRSRYPPHRSTRGVHWAKSYTVCSRRFDSIVTHMCGWTSMIGRPVTG